MIKRPNHEKVPKDQLQKGQEYVFVHNTVPVYEAEVMQYGGGCWATVRVTNPLGNTQYYKAGDEFEIRVAVYEISPKAESYTNLNC